MNDNKFNLHISEEAQTAQNIHLLKVLPHLARINGESIYSDEMAKVDLVGGLYTPCRQQTGSII